MHRDGLSFYSTATNLAKDILIRWYTDKLLPKYYLYKKNLNIIIRKLLLIPNETSWVTDSRSGSREQRQWLERLSRGGKNWQQPKIIKKTTLPRSFNVFISSFSVESLSFSSEQWWWSKVKTRSGRLRVNRDLGWSRTMARKMFAPFLKGAKL